LLAADVVNSVLAADYAELLGLYLGDGHITRMARTQRLRLMLDAKYPVIVEDAADLLHRVAPWNKGRPAVPARRPNGDASRIPRALDLPIPTARTGQEARSRDRA
jgi:hypothetical protein